MTTDAATKTVYDDVERILDDESAWIARPSKAVTMRIALAATMTAMEHTKRDNAERVLALEAHLAALEAENKSLREERERWKAFGADSPQGHGDPCYYCGKPCNGFAGNPGEWPIPLCHADDPGRVKWHHIDCVSSRLAAPRPPSNEVIRVDDEEVGKTLLHKLRTYYGDDLEARSLLIAAAREIEGLSHQLSEAREVITEIAAYDENGPFFKNTIHNALNLARGFLSIRALKPSGETPI